MERKLTVVKSHSYHIMAEDTCYPHEVTGDVNLAHLGKVAFAKDVYSVKSLFSSPPLFIRSESLGIAYFECWGCSGIKPPPERGSMYVLLNFFCKEDCSLLPPVVLCIYLFTLSFI